MEWTVYPAPVMTIARSRKSSSSRPIWTTIFGCSEWGLGGSIGSENGMTLASGMGHSFLTGALSAQGKKPRLPVRPSETAGSCRLRIDAHKAEPTGGAGAIKASNDAIAARIHYQHVHEAHLIKRCCKGQIQALSFLARCVKK